MPSLRGLTLALSVLVACSRASAPAAAPAPRATLPGGVTAAMITQGDSLFNGGACIRCHGAQGVGGANGPSLTAGPWLQANGSFDDLVRVITTGVPRSSIKEASRRFAMNPRGGPMNLTDDQVRLVASYVWSISRDKPSP